VHLSICHDFPFDTTRALELALFRTFCVPSVSALLDATGEFGQRAQKRYDDTDILVAEMVVHGFSSERGGRALERMNAIHGRHRIANDDLRYVLSTFIFEPIRWNARFGWRRLIEPERLAYFEFWRAIGERMGIADLPRHFEAFETFNTTYERLHFRYHPTNQRVGEATREMLVGWFPPFLSPAIRAVIHAMLEEPVRVAFGFPRAPRWLGPGLTLALNLRRRALAAWPFPRTYQPGTERFHPTYPQGYEIERLGPVAGATLDRRRGE
jgi:hypothetical protein